MSPRGPAAESIADLTVLMVALGAAVYVGFLVVLVAALRRHGGSSSPVDAPADGPGRWTGIGPVGARRLVVGGGVVLPVVVIGLVYAATLETMLDLAGLDAAREHSETLVVDVTGSQWQWSVDYRGTGITLVDEVYVPVDRPVEVRLRSDDVIHSFWVPELAGKLDALPDRTNTLIIEASEPGRFDGRCAEFCGLHHTGMTFTVVALEQPEFDAWLVDRTSRTDPSEGDGDGEVDE